MRPTLRSILAARKVHLVVVVVVLAALTFNHLSDNAIGDAVFRPAPVVDDPPGAWDQHPVVLLHQQAEREHRAFVDRQSKSPEEAEREYRRRYGRDPPRGFGRWVEHALAQGSPVIDDFDVIAQTVHPFLKHSPAELKRRVDAAMRAGDADHLSVCRFEHGRFTSGCRIWGTPYNALLGSAAQLIPDVDLLMNFLDEPSILPAHNVSAAAAPEPWKHEDLARKSIAAAVRESCRAQGLETGSPDAQGGDAGLTLGIPFVTGSSHRGTDLCRHPEYDSQHGFVATPTTLKRLPWAVPLLSQSAPGPFADIIMPSYLYSRANNMPSSWADRPWASKKNAVYWAGSTTGGEWSPDSWRSGLRQRLVMLGTGKSDESRNATLLQRDPATGRLAPQAGAEVDTSAYEVGFTNVINCDASPAAGDEQRRFFGVPSGGAPRQPPSRALRYRLALDLDGNSFSMRFYRLLASRSCALKVTVFREWHDDRLRPWLHYVPVGVGMRDLPELVRFLTQTAAGQRVAERVAEAGSEWYHRAVSPKHQGIYMYRLMLEMARLQEEGRVAG